MSDFYKKLLSAYLLIFCLSIVLGVAVTNADIAVPGPTNPALEGPTTNLNKLNNSPIQSSNDIFDRMAGIVRWLYRIFFVIAIYFLLLTGFNYLTAGGNPEKIQKAHGSLIWALVAIVIALLSVGIAQIITSFLTA